MPIYEYKGVGPSGKPSKGIVEADSAKTARGKLKQKGVFTTDIREKATGRSSPSSRLEKTGFSSGTVKMKNLTLMIRQLSTLIKARIPLGEALTALTEQTNDTRLKSIMSDVKESVNAGKSLADSCKAYPKVFSPIFISMIRVGEASGNLDLVLNRLASFTEGQFELRNKVIGAMAYPA